MATFRSCGRSAVAIAVADADRRRSSPSSSPATSAEQRRLAAARRPDQHDELAVGDVERAVGERTRAAVVGLVDVLEDDRAPSRYSKNRSSREHGQGARPRSGRRRSGAARSRRRVGSRSPRKIIAWSSVRVDGRDGAGRRVDGVVEAEVAVDADSRAASAQVRVAAGGIDGERQRGRVRRHDARWIADRAEVGHAVLAVAAGHRASPTTTMPHTGQAERLGRVAALHASRARRRSRRGSPARARLVEDERRHERLEEAAPPRRHVAHVLPLVPAAEEGVRRDASSPGARCGTCAATAGGGNVRTIANQCASARRPCRWRRRLPSRDSA